MEHISDNKRLAKNTLYLYFRMFITLIVGLYTSRVVLNTLGVTDYGIYNVIGGIVAIFATLNSAMASTSSRYITFYLGKDNNKQLNEIFSSVALVHFAIAIIVVIACETIGLWFFYKYMQIPADRVDVAFWLLQLSFASSFLLMINIPYTGLIIGHENMDVYAYLSIFDVIMKLLIAFLIQVSPVDRLLFYGILIFVVQIIDFWVYRLYSIRKYKESHIIFFLNKTLLKELSSYFGWSIIGNLAVVCNTQGINLLLNMFFGPTINAARGVAVQVQGIINNFVGNFQTALNPQIIKTYAGDEMHRMHYLMFASSKYGFLLLFLISFPIIIEAQQILHLWLGLVPEHTVNFLRIIILSCMVNSLANSSTVASGATGKIRIYSIVVGGIVLLPIIFAYFALKVVGNPELVFVIVLFFEILALFARLLMMKRMISMSFNDYGRNVFLPIFKVLMTSMWLPFLLYKIMDNSIYSMIVVCFVCLANVILAIYFVGLTKNEQTLCIKVLRSKMPFIKSL